MIQRIGVWDRLCGDHRFVGEMICEIAENGRSSLDVQDKVILRFRGIDSHLQKWRFRD